MEKSLRGVWEVIDIFVVFRNMGERSFSLQWRYISFLSFIDTLLESIIKKKVADPHD